MTGMNVREVPVRRFNREHEMNVFDHLPPVIREEMRNTSITYSAIEVGDLLVGGHSVGAVLSVLQGEDRRLQGAYRRKIGL